MEFQKGDVLRRNEAFKRYVEDRPNKHMYRDVVGELYEVQSEERPEILEVRVIASKGLGRKGLRALVKKEWIEIVEYS